MSPRRSVAEASRTRDAIVDRAVEVASQEGLEGLTIGRLAGDLDMSKAGLIGHFGSKERLQLAAFEAAADTFKREIWDPVEGRRPGLDRLRAICDRWVKYLERPVFPGGCFFAAAATEFDDRGGEVRDAVAAQGARWRRALMREVRAAVDNGELPKGTDPEQLAFELYGVMLVLNNDLKLQRDPKAATRARRSVKRLLT
jgi:AcrR family transcriptional regulator